MKKEEGYYEKFECAITLSFQNNKTDVSFD